MLFRYVSNENGFLAPSLKVVFINLFEVEEGSLKHHHNELYSNISNIEMVRNVVQMVFNEYGARCSKSLSFL